MRRGWRHFRAILAMSSSDIANNQPELLAQHYTVAERYEAAIDYWLSAGRRATSRAADREALANLNQALGLLHNLPESSSRDRQELSVRVAAIAPTMAVMGQGSQGMQDAVAAALVISDRVGDSTELFPLLFSDCIDHGHHAKHKEATLRARELSRRASRQSDVVPRLVAHRALGFSSLYLGELRAARRELEQVVEQYDEPRHAELTVTYGSNMKSLSLSYLSWVARLEGTADRATSLARAALEHAQAIGHIISLGIVPWLDGMSAACMRDAKRLRACSDRLLELGDCHGVDQWLLVGTGFSALADLLDAPDDKAASRVTDHIDARVQSGFLCFITLYYAELAEAQAEMGRVDDALEALDAAAAIVEEGGERLFEAEVLRARGVVEARRNHADLATTWLQRAVEVARDQGNRQFELRAALSSTAAYGRSGINQPIVAVMAGNFRNGSTAPAESHS